MAASFLGQNEVFIIAEIGGNHEGDFQYAKRLLCDAIESGASAVKFQSYKADSLVSPIENPERHKHFRKFELSDEQFIELASLCQESGATFMSSLWDREAINRLDPYIQIHKIGSGDLTNYPILEAIAKKNKPVILSTAMATLEEIRDAVKFIESANSSLVPQGKLALLHCVAMYGDPKDEYANLLSIRVLQEAFPHLSIGYSDHTIGTYACELAMAMGASILEVHFTDDKSRAFRDHQISATAEELKALIEKGKRIRTLLGRNEKKPISAIETPSRIEEFRRAVYLTQDVPAGTVLTDTVLTTLRPNRGIDARNYYSVLGRRLKIDKKAYQALDSTDLE